MFVILCSNNTTCLSLHTTAHGDLDLPAESTAESPETNDAHLIYVWLCLLENLVIKTKRVIPLIPKKQEEMQAALITANAVASVAGELVRFAALHICLLFVLTRLVFISAILPKCSYLQPKTFSFFCSETQKLAHFGRKLPRVVFVGSRGRPGAQFVGPERPAASRGTCTSRSVVCPGSTADAPSALQATGRSLGVFFAHPRKTAKEGGATVGTVCIRKRWYEV